MGGRNCTKQLNLTRSSPWVAMSSSETCWVVVRGSPLREVRAQPAWATASQSVQTIRWQGASSTYAAFDGPDRARGRLPHRVRAHPSSTRKHTGNSVRSLFQLPRLFCRHGRIDAGRPGAQISPKDAQQVGKRAPCADTADEVIDWPERPHDHFCQACVCQTVFKAVVPASPVCQARSR